MDDSSIDAGLDAPTESKLPIGLAIAGIVLGGLAFIFAFTAKNQITRLSDNVNNEVTELNARVEKALAEVRANGGDTQKLDAVSADIEAFKAQVQTNFQSVTASYQNLAAAVESMKGGRAQPTGNTGAGNSGATGTANSGEYAIKKGDTFSSIAKTLGCKTKDLEVLNPDVNPNKLKIGQRIKIPAKR